MTIVLYKLEKTFRHFVASFILLMTISVSTGLVLVYQTTSYTDSGVVERYKGSLITDDELDIPDQYPKSEFEMLLNTHNHLFGFSVIFLCIGSIFYFNSTITNGWKYFLLIEPFISVLITFSGLWLIRFLDPLFVYFVFAAAVISYLSYFFMTTIILYELLLKPNRTINE